MDRTLVESSLNEPLKVIQSLFEKNCNDTINNEQKIKEHRYSKYTATNEHQSYIEEQIDYIERWGVYNHFNQLLSVDGVYDAIPLVQSIASSDSNMGKLVRIRCMIQEIFDPQFYNGICKIKNNVTGESRYETGAFKNYIDINDKDEQTDKKFEGMTFERSMLFCIPIPCQNDWVTLQQSNNQSNTKQEQPQQQDKSRKRSLEDNGNDDEMKDDINNNNNSTSTTPTITKILKEDSKKQEEPSYEKGNEIQKVYNFPIPSQQTNLSPFLVKVYHQQQLQENESNNNNNNNNQEYFKTNQIVEFVGIISKFYPEKPQISNPNPSLEELMMYNLDFDQNNAIPESLVPQFHTVAYKILDEYKLPSNYKYPFTTTTSTSSTTITNTKTKEETQSIRNELMEYLKSQLWGDQVLAEYFICYLLSKIYLVNRGMCLGNFTLNVILGTQGSHSEVVDRFEQLLAQLTQRSHRFRVTIDNLNDGDFVPFKDYDQNRLISGLLQLPKNTHLLIDETCLKEGKLLKQGIGNLQALKDLALFQRVEYDFQYHPIEMQADIQLLLLSNGKSLIPSSCQVNFKPSTSTQQEHSITQDKLDQFREYIGIVMNNSLEASKPEVVQLIEDDYVATRQEQPNTPQEIFHYWLTLSRLLSLSFGENQITSERWKYMRGLEEKRNNQNNNK